jgi:hypothetical protein
MGRDRFVPQYDVARIHVAAGRTTCIRLPEQGTRIANTSSCSRRRPRYVMPLADGSALRILVTPDRALMSRHAHPLRTGLSTTRYELERELGAGGMATVYLALRHKHDRHVALKVLHPELAPCSGGERFLAANPHHAAPTCSTTLHPGTHGLGRVRRPAVLRPCRTMGRRVARARLQRAGELPVQEGRCASRMRWRRAPRVRLTSARHPSRHQSRRTSCQRPVVRLLADSAIALRAVQQWAGGRLTQTGCSLSARSHVHEPRAGRGRQARRRALATCTRSRRRGVRDARGPEPRFSAP